MGQKNTRQNNAPFTVEFPNGYFVEVEKKEGGAFNVDVYTATTSQFTICFYTAAATESCGTTNTCQSPDEIYRLMAQIAQRRPVEGYVPAAWYKENQHRTGSTGKIISYEQFLAQSQQVEISVKKSPETNNSVFAYRF